MIKAPYGDYPRTAELLGGWIPLVLAIIVGIMLGNVTKKILQKNKSE